MRFLVDVCLSIELVERLNGHGMLATHWSAIGPGNAKDREILRWAVANNHVIVSADLDFGDLLALSDAALPSVILVRSEDQAPHHVAPLILAAAERFQEQLVAGCLISIDDARARMRMLPLR